MKRAQVRRAAEPKKDGMNKPFRPEVYVATFSDAALRDALDELRQPFTPKGGVVAALRKTIEKSMQLGASTISAITRSIVYEEAAGRWARDYDRAVTARLRSATRSKRGSKRKPKR